MEMKPMKKIEIIINSTYLSKIIEVLEKTGSTGYTVIKDIVGKGERGIMRGDEITDVFKNNYVFTICPPEIASKVIENLKPVLKSFGGVCITSDVIWLKY